MALPEVTEGQRIDSRLEDIEGISLGLSMEENDE